MFTQGLPVARAERSAEWGRVAAAVALGWIGALAFSPGDAQAARKCFGKQATIVVKAKSAKGTKGRDVIVVKRKRGAQVNGRGGNDLICGGPGPDALSGGPGNDKIKGGAGDDLLVAGKGNDRLLGQGGVDRFLTKPGKATTDAGPGEFVDGRQLPSTQRVSVSSDGAQADAESGGPKLSDDGRFVMFSSPAGNLVPGDTNGAWDVFVHDRWTGETICVSVGMDGLPAGGVGAAISGNGRYVAFSSLAGNLVPGDTNGNWDAFVRDLETKTTERVSLSAAGTEASSGSDSPSISDDGRFVAFVSDANDLVSGDSNGEFDVFVRDREAGTTERVSVGVGGQGNGASYVPQISGNGRYVVFTSAATNLVAGDTNNRDDVFIHDRGLEFTQRVSITAAGGQAADTSMNPSISDDGSRIAFESWANLVPGDANSAPDIFVRDVNARTTRRVSISSSGVEADQPSFTAVVSGDGRYIAFTSHATNLVPGDTNEQSDVFVHDLETGETTRVSVTNDGLEAADRSLAPGLSDDGRFVGFVSYAENLVASDANGKSDIFVRDRGG